MRRYREIYLCLTMILCVLFEGIFSTESAAEEVKEQVIRLHVLANSNSEDDQQLKLTVRDEVLRLSESFLWTAKSRKEAERLIAENLEKIKKTAEKTVALAGYDYSVAISLQNADFETRDYGSFALPLGEYLSLQLVLGEGKGKNWWCVLYPPLCLSSAAEEEFLSGLSKEEQALLTDAKRYEARLWFIEALKKLFKHSHAA